jgi:hypothetical protein
LTKEQAGVYNSPIIAKKGGMYIVVSIREEIRSNESYLYKQESLREKGVE